LQVPTAKRAGETRDKKTGGHRRWLSCHDPAQRRSFALDLLRNVQRSGLRPVPTYSRELGLAYYGRRQHFPGVSSRLFFFLRRTMPEKCLVETELLREAALLPREELTESRTQRAKAKVVGQKKSPDRMSARSR